MRGGSEPPPSWTGVAVGEVVGAHALRGLLRVRAYHPPASSLSPGRVVRLERDGLSETLTVASAAPHGRGLVLLALEGVDDRDGAERLIGTRVLVDPAELPPPAEDEFYYHELLGFAVETAAGRPLGTLTETFATGLNDVWVVREGPREYLIPVIADVVRTIDRRGRRIVIEPLPGLLD